MKAPNLPLGPLVVNPLHLAQICKEDGSMQVAMVDTFHPARVTVDYARLFAAAPELLASLMEMTAEFGVDGHGGEFEDGESALIDRARAAISKATGSAA